MSRAQAAAELAVPTVHLNGTGRRGLVEQYRAAIEALQAAADALRQCAPHGRDYYPQGPDAFQSAQREHVARCQRVGDVYDELTELALAVMEGGA